MRWKTRGERTALMLALVVLLTLLGFSGTMRAQDDGLNLPTELYILLNSGVVERYGLGATGVESVTPDDVFVVDFAIAPDGNWLAYRTEDGLTLTYMPDGRDEPGRQLEGQSADVPPVRGRGSTMAWSPEGDALAYTTSGGLRAAFNVSAEPGFQDIPGNPLVNLSWSPEGTHLAAETEDNVWWIYRRAGDELVLTSALPSSVGLAWYDDARLIFAPEDGGMFFMDLAAANQQLQIRETTARYQRPYVRADGVVLAFIRDDNMSELEANQAYLRRFVIGDGALIPTETSETPFDLTRLRWAPGGQLLIAFRGGVVILVLPTTGDGFPLPIANAVAYDWGADRPPQATDLTLPAAGYFLAPDILTGATQLWRLPPDVGPPERLTEADADLTAYTVTPNGATIAYVSDGTLWAQNTNNPDSARELTAVNPAADDLIFSPDGTSIFYTTPSTDSDPVGGIWTVPAAGGDAQLVLANGPDVEEPVAAPPFYSRPRFAPNVNALLVTVSGAEATSHLILDTASGGLVELDAYDHAEWLSDGRILAYRGAELFIVDVSADPPAELSLLAGDEDERIIATIEAEPGRIRALLAGDEQRGPASLAVYDAAMDGSGAGMVVDAGFIVAPSFSADGDVIAGYTREDGLLVFFTPADGVRVLETPTGISAFRWATFR